MRAALAIIALLILAACATPIADLKDEDNVGKSFTLKGTVEKSYKLGGLSGYTLKDDSGTIGVSSKTLPEEGSKVTVKGTLIKDTLLGYYLKSD